MAALGCSPSSAAWTLGLMTKAEIARVTRRRIAAPGAPCDVHSSLYQGGAEAYDLVSAPAREPIYSCIE